MINDERAVSNAFLSDYKQASPHVEESDFFPISVICKKRNLVSFFKNVRPIWLRCKRPEISTFDDVRIVRSDPTGLGQGGHLLSLSLSLSILLPRPSAHFVHSFIRRMSDPLGECVRAYMYYTCIYLILHVCPFLCRYGYNLRAASSTTANLHRHHKWKMLASPNLPFLHLLHAVRVNVTSPA